MKVEGPTEANDNCQKVCSGKGIIWLFYLTEVVIICVVVDDEAEDKIQGKVGVTLEHNVCVYKHTHTHTHGIRASLVSQSVKNLPAMQETQFIFLGQEDSLEKEMAPYSSILAWRIPWTEETGRLQSMGLQELDTT